MCPAPKDVLGYEFLPTYQWNEREAIISARKFPSSSFSESPLSEELLARFPEASVSYLPTALDRQAYYNGIRKQAVISQLWDDNDASDCLNLLEYYYGGVLGNCDVVPFDEVDSSTDLGTSPGFPLYFRYAFKSDVEGGALDWVRQITEEYLACNIHVIPVWTATLKDEMTLQQKARDHVTRLFKNGPWWFLRVGKHLFGEQNARMHELVGSHPNTIGVQMPGTEFLNIFFDGQMVFDQLVSGGYTPLKDGLPPTHGPYVGLRDDDKGSWDASFPLTGAACLRDFRANHLAPELYPVVSNYYDDTYCGRVAYGGNLCFNPSQNSGGILTGDDNSLANTIVEYPPTKSAGLLGPLPLETYVKGHRRHGGDDSLIVSVFYKHITIDEYASLLSHWCIYYSSSSGFTDDVFDCMFYSHKPIAVRDPFDGSPVIIAKPRLRN